MFKKHRADLTIAAVLLIVALIPRAIDLGLFLTADEKNWIGRSYEFIRAFKDWRFNDMLQTTHPGVTTLWLAGAAVSATIVLRDVPFSFSTLPHFVSGTQGVLAVVTALVVPGIYFLLRRLWSTQRLLPVLASALIALDPFLIGYSRVVHVDALLASLLFVATLATLVYVRLGYSERWLIVSAMLSGLALLTKAPAVFLVPFFWLAVWACEGRALWRWRTIVERGRDFILWLLLVGLIFVLLWPAMLFVSNPKGNVLVVKRDLVTAAATPHHMAEAYSLNAYHYVFTLLTRTTPVTLGFASVAILWLGLSRVLSRPFPRPTASVRSTVWLLIAYAFFFILMMTLGAKKGDRYILPAWPAIDVLAAVGLAVVGRWLAHIAVLFKIQGSRFLRYLVTAPALLALLYLGAVDYRYHPYAIAYSNPLFPDNLSQELGWGEGLEQVGEWLNRTDPDSIVASWYPEELGAYTSAHVAHINAHEQPRVHYVVLYRNMFGRAPDHYANNFIDEYYKKLEPVFVARVVGKEFAWVYEKETYERVIGEMVPGVRGGQQLAGARDARGIELAIATYSGRANKGEVVVEARSNPGGAALQTWRVPVKDITDNAWQQLDFAENIAWPETIFIEVHAEGTSANNAPTLRYSSEYDYRSSDFYLSTSGALAEHDKKSGDAAIRTR
ncbi:MAG TPA: hypothetical protein VJC05_01315 [Candidatus Andersenbacteria bacterium]|nr:hypothetical protein [Candidatus Andersenbacteria bacterium]